MTLLKDLYPLDLLVGEEVNLLGDVDIGIVKSRGKVLIPVLMEGIGFFVIVVHVHTQLQNS